MLWPASWKDASALDLLKGTAINYLLIEKNADLGPVVEAAQKRGYKIAEQGAPIAHVSVVKGEWPGVKLTESGFLDRAAAGPTGTPWVDSNGWKVRLAAALQEDCDVWVDAAPQKPRFSASAYVVGVADAAVHGGRWILRLDDQLAANIAGRQPDARETWEKVTAAAGFFAARRRWSEYRPEAVIGIISDFAGKNEFMSNELLNLIARTNQQYCIIPKSKVREPDFHSLKALLYADEDPPDSKLRKQILAFVESGGMLITGPKWGELPGIPAKEGDHPRYAIRTFGKGRLALAKPDFEDPYLVASDSAVLISHRHELLRFWNGGAVGSYFSLEPSRKQALVQLLFYAFIFRDNRPTVRVSGQYRTSKLWTLDRTEPRSVEMDIQKDAVELHLPPVSSYAAVELF